MTRLLTFLFALQLSLPFHAQELYFPPTSSDDWESLQPEALGWNTGAIPTLYDYLDSINSKAFIVLKDGKIVLEQYFDGFSLTDEWYWASAGKTLCAFMTGIAQQESYLSIDDPVSMYLGNGWTSLPSEQENNIKIIHQLTMTSGLDDGVMMSDCTLPACLQYKSEPGTRWAYHNAPYTLIQSVISAATGKNFNQYMQETLRNSTGIEAAFRPVGFNRVCFSTPRNMAKFGLLILANGTWNGTSVLSDSDYFESMVTPSNSLNPSYGYLWWLNGQSTFMLPSLQISFPGPLFPDAPMDMIAALGLNGQLILVIPSENMVVIRMGESPGTGPVSAEITNEIMKRLKEITDTSVSTERIELNHNRLSLFPIPASNQLTILGGNPGRVSVWDSQGGLLKIVYHDLETQLDISTLNPGKYIIHHQHSGSYSFIKVQ